MKFSHTGDVEILSTTIQVEFHCTITPIYPATGPSYASGGEPECGGEVEIESAVLLINTQRDGKKWDRIDAPPWLLRIMEEDTGIIDGLAEYGREQLADDGPDPDAERDARRDEGL